jgi:hypothetical protein
VVGVTNLIRLPGDQATNSQPEQMTQSHH